MPPRFVVEVVTYLPGTRHEPPDSDVTEDSTHTTIDSALLRVCELLVQEKAQAFLEREGEVREAAEIAALGAS